MKQIIYASAAILFCVVSCPAEVMDEIYFNPTRWGQYENLKITNKLTANTIEITALNVRSNGTATMTVPNTGTITIATVDNILGGTIDMPNTAIQPKTVNFTGGYARFTTGNITTLNATVAPQVQATSLTVEGTLSLTPPSGAVSTIENGAINGLKLGPYVIPLNSFPYNNLEWVTRKGKAASGKDGKFKVLAAFN